MVVRVKDFDQSVSTWRDSFGLNLDRVDQNEALGIKQAFFNLENGGFIEIVSPTDDDSAVGKAIVKQLQDNGVSLIGVGGPQVFIHPKSANGILVQLTPKS